MAFIPVDSKNIDKSLCECFGCKLPLQQDPDMDIYNMFSFDNRLIYICNRCARKYCEPLKTDPLTATCEQLSKRQDVFNEMEVYKAEYNRLVLEELKK